MNDDIHLSVVIPAYNEEKRLPKTLKSINDYLVKQSYGYEIIVVNDGAKDKTADVVKSLMPTIKNLQLIDNKVNQGKGAVTRQGMLAAKGKYRIFTDADNSTTINQVEKMFPEFEKGFDVVIGSRDVKGAILNPPQGPARRFVGNVFNLMVQVILGLWGVWDTQCGFKAMTEKATLEIMPMCKVNRFAFDPEILILARRKGYKIKEIPVIWVNDLQSTVTIKAIYRMLRDLLGIRWNLITGKYK